MPKEERRWDRNETTEGAKSDELRRELQKLRSLISPNAGAYSDVKPPSEKGKARPVLSKAELEEAINKAKLLVSQEEMEETKKKVREIVFKRIRKPRKA